MAKIGFYDVFIKMAKLLFVDHEAMVNVNEQPTKSFPIQRG